MRFIAVHAFKSLLREKILFNIFGVTLLLLFFGYLASKLVYGNQYRVMLDLGLTMNALSVFAVAGSIGARMFRTEIENGTIYLFLARPISRTRFYLGRFFGMVSFVFLNFAILSLILAAFVAYSGGELGLAYWQSVGLTFLESAILLGVSLLLGFWMRPALTLMAVFALVFLGHNQEMIRSLSETESSIPLFGVLNAALPRLSAFLMADRVYYGEALSVADWSGVLLYGVSWLLLFLLLGNTVFSKKNL